MGYTRESIVSGCVQQLVARGYTVVPDRLSKAKFNIWSEDRTLESPTKPNTGKSDMMKMIGDRAWTGPGLDCLASSVRSRYDLRFM